MEPDAFAIRFARLGSSEDGAALMAFPHDGSPYRTFTASQRMLRYIGVIYFVWCVFSCALNVVMPALALLFGRAVSGVAPAALAQLVLCAVASAANFACAVAMWYVANHPRCAHVFRFVAIGFLVLNVLPLVASLPARHLAGMLSSAYNVALTGLIAWLAVQMDREHSRGIAVDRCDLPRTVTGKVLRTERAVERAEQAGTLAACEAEREPRAERDPRI